MTLTLSSKPLRMNSESGTQSLTRQVTAAPLSKRRRTSQPPRSPLAPVTKVGRSCQKELLIPKSSRVPFRFPKGGSGIHIPDKYPSRKRNLGDDKPSTVLRAPIFPAAHVRGCSRRPLSSRTLGDRRLRNRRSTSPG